jgi:hypothetical protein
MREKPRKLRWTLMLGLLAALSAGAQQEISDAEKRLFSENHLKNVPNNTTLNYTFSKTGAHEKNFEDKVTIAVKASPKAEGKGKSCHVEFLTGEHKFNLPDIEEAGGNPVLLSFLERDIREMNRITRGPINYFRHRVRLAFAKDADVKAVDLKVDGKDLKGHQIIVSPFEDDPTRVRFERFSNKSYIITLSDQVPGGIYQLRSIMKERDDTSKPGEKSSISPMIDETLTFSGSKK